MICRSVIGILVLASVVTAKKGSTGSVLSDILDDLDLHSDNRVRPGYGEGELEIHAFAYIHNIIEISEETSTMTVNMLLMQMWNDGRLSFDGTGPGNSSLPEILVDNPDYQHTFWNPDTFIMNEVATNTRYTTAGNGDRNLANQVVRLSRNGDVLKTSRITVTVSCPMRFDSFPLHSFDCDIEMESFGHKASDIIYLWRNGSKSVDLSKIDKHALAGKSTYKLEYVETHSQQSYLETGGSYSRLIIRFRFKKLWLRHAITFFIPTTLLTILSLASLWVISHTHALAGVIGNFILACLVIILMGLEYSTAGVLGRVPFFTPVDFHLGICVVTVFSAIAFHSVRLCFSNSTCCCDDHGKEGSKVVTEELPKKRKPGVKTRTLRTHEDEVTYYESYDVTNENAHNDQVFTEDLGVLRKEDDQKRSSILAFLYAGLLNLSRWISLLTFVGAEVLLWYTFGLATPNGTHRTSIIS